MMKLVIPTVFDERACAMLALLRRQPDLCAEIWAQVSAFYQRHPEVERTEVGTALLASIILSVWADGAAPETKTKAA